MSYAERKALDLLRGLTGHGLYDLAPDNPITSQQAVTMLWAMIEGAFLPRPLLSECQAQRCAHEDLPLLDDTQLWREMKRAETLLIWTDEPHEWIVARHHACQDEIRCRKSKG